MIHYQYGRFGLCFLFQLRGSVFPKAAMWAVPSTMWAMGLFVLKAWSGYEDDEASGSILFTAISAFITILGFMVVFRSNQAWTRYWEGMDLILQARGSWVSATSSLIAFCSRKKEKHQQVRAFQNKMVRLTSLLFSTALHTVSDEDFDKLDLHGLDPVALSRKSAREEVNIELIVYWIQRTVTHNIDAGVLDAPPPILSRVFNELADGVVKMSAARKIKILQFPFHYAQMLGVMLVVYTIGAPAASAYLMRSWYGAASSAFINVFTLWCINYLAIEIEQPFGKKPNDLPLEYMTNGMNSILVMLLREGDNEPPDFDLDMMRPLIDRQSSLVLDTASRSRKRNISMLKFRSAGMTLMSMSRMQRTNRETKVERPMFHSRGEGESEGGASPGAWRLSGELSPVDGVGPSWFEEPDQLRKKSKRKTSRASRAKESATNRSSSRGQERPGKPKTQTRAGDVVDVDDETSVYSSSLSVFDSGPRAAAAPAAFAAASPAAPPTDTLVVEEEICSAQPVEVSSPSARLALQPQPQQPQLPTVQQVMQVRQCSTRPHSQDSMHSAHTFNSQQLLPGQCEVFASHAAMPICQSMYQATSKAAHIDISKMPSPKPPLAVNALPPSQDSAFSTSASQGSDNAACGKSSPQRWV